MKTQFVKWIKGVSIAVVVLGCIHLLMTPVIMHGLNYLKADDKLAFLFMFVAAGIGTILPGIVVLTQIRGFSNFERSAWLLSFICAIYVLLLGLLAVITMMTNPFAYICLVVGFFLFIPLVRVRKKYLL